MRVTFKHEGEAAGEPFGPVTVIEDDATAKPGEWVYLSHALRIAAEHGVTLEQV